MGHLAEIFRRHGPAYRAQFARRMPLDQLRAMRSIERCRTAALGGMSGDVPSVGRSVGRSIPVAIVIARPAGRTMPGNGCAVRRRCVCR
jgi:hypothetical protein